MPFRQYRFLSHRQILRQYQVVFNHYLLLIYEHFRGEVLSYTRDTAELEEEKIVKTEEMKTEGKEKERPKVNSGLTLRLLMSYIYIWSS